MHSCSSPSVWSHPPPAAEGWRLCCVEMAVWMAQGIQEIAQWIQEVNYASEIMALTNFIDSISLYIQNSHLPCWLPSRRTALALKEDYFSWCHFFSCWTASCIKRCVNPLPYTHSLVVFPNVELPLPLLVHPTHWTPDFGYYSQTDTHLQHTHKLTLKTLVVSEWTFLSELYTIVY